MNTAKELRDLLKNVPDAMMVTQVGELVHKDSTFIHSSGVVIKLQAFYVVGRHLYRKPSPEDPKAPPDSWGLLPSVNKAKYAARALNAFRPAREARAIQRSVKVPTTDELERMVDELPVESRTKAIRSKFRPKGA